MAEARVSVDADDALYRVVHNGDWEQCRVLLRRPNADRLARYQDRDGNTGLHLACLRSAPLDVVVAILDADPSSAHRTSRSGWTPIHSACDGDHEEAVALLLERSPRLASVPDNIGRIPIHVAVARRRSPAIVERLLRAHPASVRTSDVYFGTPLVQFAAAWRQGRRRPATTTTTTDDDAATFQRTLSSLLAAYSRGTVASSEDEDEWRLVHGTMRHSVTVPLPTTLVQALLDVASRAECARPDRRGDFPLHVLCAQPGHRATSSRQFHTLLDLALVT